MSANNPVLDNSVRLPNSLRLKTTSSTLNKQSSNQDFSTKLRETASHSTRFASHVLNNVASALPGGAIVSAALNDAASNLSPNIGGSGIQPFQTASAFQGPVSSGNMFSSMASLHENMMSQNVYMLGLQRKFQQMSEEYMAISNILKMKYETEKTSISNMR